MAKWQIPRHSIRHKSAEYKSAINAQRRVNTAADKVRRASLKRRAERKQSLQWLAEVGSSEARIELGTCVRKRQYATLAEAKRAALAEYFKCGVEIWVYRCQFCGAYHLTSTFIASKNYEFHAGRH